MYARGGDDGPPIVFVHGWALGSRAYKRAVNRLVARGCQVFAPALPSFGGTADLPARDMGLDGYARWLASFMEAVGIAEPALIIGHSFGGGVSIKLAESRPDLVSYLVLLNAVGGVGSRPMWQWMAAFGRDLWPPTDAIEVLQAARADLIPNLIRNPCGLLRAGRVAKRADLRAESARLRAQGVPVLALTSDSDRIIPKGAFEALCQAIGSDGRVVSGGHSWMLADPDSFSAALGPIVDLRVSEHRSTRAATRGEEIARLLADNDIPAVTVRELLSEAPPLWLISEDAPVLAGDLLLCHPELRRDEVRAVARPLDASSASRITVVARDRRGLLADSAAVLAASGLSISRASAATWTEAGLALHSFVVEGGDALDGTDWSQLGERLQVMASTRSLPAFGPGGDRRVTVYGGEGDRMMVTVTAPDDVGLLSSLCRALSDGGVDIESLAASTSGGVARDTFLVAGVTDAESVRRMLTSTSRRRPARTGGTEPGGRPRPPRTSARPASAP